MLAHAAVGGHAADGAGRDGFQLIAEACSGGGAAGLGAHQEARDGVQDGGQNVNADDRRRDIDAGHLGRALVSADGVHVLAVPGLVIQEQHIGPYDDGENGQIRNGAQGAQGHLGIGALEAAQGVVARHHGAEAVDNGLHAQGGDEGGHFQESDDAAVNGSEHGHDDDDQQQGREPRKVRHPGQSPGGVVHALEHHGGKAGGEAHLTAGGQVRALGNQASGDTAGDDEPGGHVDHQILEVSGLEEVIRNAAHHKGQEQNENNDGVVGQEIHDGLRGNFSILHGFSPPYSNWVARAMMFSWLASFPSMKPVTRPSHMTMIRSDMPISSLISEEIMMTLLPCLASSAMMQ